MEKMMKNGAAGNGSSQADGKTEAGSKSGVERKAAAGGKSGIERKSEAGSKPAGNGKAAGGKSAAQLRKQAASRQAHLRAILQVIFFLSMPSGFVAGFSGVKYIFTQMGTGSVIAMNSFVLTLIGLCVFTILFGRFFCGYVCAFGSLGDLMYWLSGLVQTKIFKRKKQIQIPDAWMRIFQKLKYAILFLIVIMCYTGVYGKLSGTSPWDVFSRVTALQFKLTGYAVGVILLVLIMIGMIFRERFFCQVLCPMGAVFSLLPILPFANLKRNEPNCIKNCTACTKKCPVALRLEKDSILSGECIRCGRCANVCPKGNIHSASLNISGSEWWMAAGKAVLFFIMGCALGLCRFL